VAGDLTDAVLEQRLFAHAGVKSGFRRRVEPDWACLACKLKRPGVNLMVLWEEYRDVHPDGYLGQIVDASEALYQDVYGEGPRCDRG